MANGIDAMTNWMQSPGRDPVLDCVLPEPKRSELPPSDHPVLSASHLTDPSVRPWLARFLSPRPREIAYTTMFCGVGGHPANVARNIACGVRGSCRLSRERRA
jgi:hypothetical protein